MKTIFLKKKIPQIESLYSAGGRAFWNLNRDIQNGTGFTRQADKEEFLLQKGAYAGDVWSMTELARYIYNKNDASFPQALSWWRKAASVQDSGCLQDLERYADAIEDRITGYSSSAQSLYGDIEIRCALMAEWILTGLGRDKWEQLPRCEKEARVRKLMQKNGMILGIPAPSPEFDDCPHTDSCPAADGLAWWNRNVITLRYALLDSYERLLQVIYHETGHFIVFHILHGNDEELKKRLRTRYGITDERIAAWVHRDMGIEVPVTEEDPDTLSYGVWTAWKIYFGG